MAAMGRNNPMEKIKRSWLLFKSSVHVVMNNKTLLVFPILSFCLTAMILVFCITPVAFIKTGFRYDQFEHWKAVGQTFFTTHAAVGHAGGAHQSGELALKPMGMVLAAGLYLVCMFLATFFNVAFFHQILSALRGGTVSVSEGLKFAVSKLPSILLWTLFAGVIGLIIKTLEERVGLLGKIILRLIGTAWSVASVFVIPVLILEPTRNPLEILKQSALTLKKTWGESLAGYLGLQFGGGVVMILSVIFLAGAAFLSAALHTFWIIGLAGVFWVIGIVAFAYLSSVASQVYRCALYVYASEGNIPAPFNQEMLDMAWKHKG
jgi:hypothetical protein